MSLKIFERMQDRLEIAKDNSDTDYFLCLMYYGEILIKIITCGFVAGIIDGKKRMQYGLKYKLVRESGIGGWVSVLDEILIGPTTSSLVIEMKYLKNFLIEKVKTGAWQYDAVAQLNNVLPLFDSNYEKIGVKANLRKWFSDFVFLRNKTRGHGAPTGSTCSEACISLGLSIKTIVDNFDFLNSTNWSYLKQNLSGKYRVVKISDTTENFDFLKSTADKIGKYEEGIYIYIDQPRRVELIYSDVDLKDFYFPNGSFTERKFEILSYLTNLKQTKSSSSYLTPADSLPPSETRGLTGLDVQGNLFGNLPNSPMHYIKRKSLEEEIIDTLKDQRNPVITLVGRGGIGKTSTALHILNTISHDDIFGLAIWFSARDIDLLPDGAKPVCPEVLTITDMASEFSKLIDPEESHADNFNSIDFFKNALTTSIETKPTIFIFDNFETLKDPVDIYRWINSNIRLPNKVIITTRYRDFIGDYPIIFSGMDETQSFELIDDYAHKLNVTQFLDYDSKKVLFEDSGGHPYIIKMWLLP